MSVGWIIEERLGWRSWVTPAPLKKKPVHRWYVFPHSFTSELVEGLVQEWGLGQEDRILDPFVGAGTTVCSAKEMGIRATGYDLSPLAVLAAKVKAAEYDISGLEGAWQILEKRLEKYLRSQRCRGTLDTYPDLVRKALPDGLLGAFDSISACIDSLSAGDIEKDFFRLAMISLIPSYSKARASGGWLKWGDRAGDVQSLPGAFRSRVTMMLEDVHARNPRTSRERIGWQVGQADARCLPDPSKTYSAVITSPPYPNRHDYTRVFGVELMFAFLDWEEARHLRYQSFHSHPEARPIRPDTAGYRPPQKLLPLLERLRENNIDPRVPAMLEGYFLDMFLCLREVSRVCKPGARVGLVVGNAQYWGEPVPVDELTAEIGEQVGLSCERILVVRYRGNSAQQMGRYGRNPSRESVVMFRLR